jgi:RNA polymerase sigma-70 factor (ECF subfamily)
MQAIMKGETTRITAWLHRLQSGDEGALNELVLHFERRLRALTQRMIRGYPLVRRYEQTDDVFQRAVLRLCRALKAVSPASTRDLLRLSAVQVRRELLNLARFHRIRPQVLPLEVEDRSAWADDEEARSTTADTADSLTRCDDDPHYLDQWTEFHERVDQLSDPEHEVFELIWYQGMTQQEVARIHCVCVRTVRKRWNAARLAIYDALDGRLPGS